MGVELPEGEKDNPLDLNSFVLVVGWDFKNWKTCLPG